VKKKMMETLLAEYRGLEQQKKDRIYTMDMDPAIKLQSKALIELDAKRVALRQSIVELEMEFDITKILTRQDEIKEAMIKEWPVEGKTFKSDLATVTLRTTKSLIIDSIKTVAEVLVKNDKAGDCIATFKLTELGKLATAGLLKDVVHYDEKQSVTIKLNEEEASE